MPIRTNNPGNKKTYLCLKFMILEFDCTICDR